MKNLFLMFLALLTFFTIALGSESNINLQSSIITIDGLPDLINQIKNVRAGIDLDKDGKEEFMFPAVFEDEIDGITDRRSIFLYENTGNDSYDLVWSYQFPGVASEFVTVDVSDLDGDGNLEILAVNVRKAGDADDGPNLYVFEYTGADNDYGTEPVVTWDLGNATRDVVRVAKAADFDGDGKQEVVLTSYFTQPAIVIASVSDFALPVWTTEYVNNEVGGKAPDIAAIGVGDMDNDNSPEIVLTEGATDKLLVIEATAANTYGIDIVDMPVATKTVSVHGIEMGDVNGDGKDETFIANLQGNVWVVTAPGDVLAITTADIHLIAETGEQWLEAGLGDLGLGGVDFVIAASNASTAEDYRYVGGNGGDVTDSTNYVTETVVSKADVEAIVPGGIRVYGLDLAGDMDKDGLQEIVFTRGSTQGGKDAPSVFIMEITPPLPDITDLDDFYWKGSNDHLPWEGPGTVSGSPGGERLEKLFDNDVNTKYLVADEESWIDVYTTTMSNVTEYTITSANDAPTRDPKNWDFQGWDATAGAWVTLHTVTDNPSWPDFFTPITWTFENSEWYSCYRLNITAINGDAQGLMQIAELEINGQLGDEVEVTTPVVIGDITDLEVFSFKGSNDHLPWEGPGTISGSPDGERLEKLFDNDSSTKYLVAAEDSWIDVYTNTLSNVKSYTITSANDAPTRDPSSWAFLGWDTTAAAWDTLHTVMDNPSWPDFFTPKTWMFKNHKYFSTYRLHIMGLNGDTQGLMQISEFDIVGLHGDTVDVAIPDYTAIEQIEKVPTVFRLSQNYPNPFNPTTAINFTIPKSGNVKLAIYDVLGREVEVLVDQRMSAGSYKADWNAANYSSGVYFYQMSTKGFTSMKKMLLVK